MSKAWGRGSTTAWRRLRLVILARDAYLCQIKGQHCTIHATHVDHILPKSVGGTDDVWNLRAACAQCNLKRGADTQTNPSPKTDWLR